MRGQIAVERGKQDVNECEELGEVEVTEQQQEK